VDKLIWQLEYDLADWLVKPEGNVDDDVWNTPVSEIFQGSGQAEGQGRLVLVTQEQKFLSNNKPFFKKPSDTFTSGGKKDELFDAISNFQGTPKIFDAHLNPSISDFTSALKNGIEEVFKFFENFKNEITLNLISNSVLAIPAEVERLLKGIWDMITETITGFFGMEIDCMFEIFPPDGIKKFFEQPILSIIYPPICSIKNLIAELGKLVGIGNGCGCGCSNPDLFPNPPVYPEPSPPYPPIAPPQPPVSPSPAPQVPEPPSPMPPSPIPPSPMPPTPIPPSPVLPTPMPPTPMPSTPMPQTPMPPTPMPPTPMPSTVLPAHPTPIAPNPTCGMIAIDMDSEEGNVEEVGTCTGMVAINMESGSRKSRNRRRPGHTQSSKRIGTNHFKGKGTEEYNNLTNNYLLNFIKDMAISNILKSLEPKKNDRVTMSCPDTRSLNFGGCKDSIFKLFPSPSKLASPIVEMALIPFKEFNNLLKDTAEPFQDTIKPTCKIIIQYWLDVQFEKLLNYEFGNLPFLAALPVTKFKIRTFYDKFLNILDHYSESLPGMKKYADDVNLDVSSLWRGNEDNLKDVFVTMHTYITGTTMIEDNMERLARKLGISSNS